MKKLVLGALFAIGSSIGCSSNGGGGGGGGGGNDTTVTVNWTFTHLADNTARSCPTGFDTTAIFSQPIDPNTHQLTGTVITDLFNCNNTSGGGGTGTIDLPAGVYLVWVEIQNHDGSSTYAQSASTYVDTTLNDTTVDTEILDDGGYFFLTWDLINSSDQIVSCASAGIDSSGAVSTISTGTATGSQAFVDKFTCTDHFGTTAGLLFGDYTIDVEAEDANNVVGTPVQLTGTINSTPNSLKDLGNIQIPID